MNDNGLTEGGGNLSQVSFATEGGDYAPDIDKTGTFMVFASTQHRPTFDVYRKSVDGRTVTQLTTDPSDDLMPSIAADGTLANKQRYDHLHVPDTADDSGADGMRVDRDGRLWVATRMGLQVCDQAGRVNVIIPTPNGRVSNLCFGGPQLDWVVATCGDKVYRRKVRVNGALNFLPPTTPAKPRL